MNKSAIVESIRGAKCRVEYFKRDMEAFGCLLEDSGHRSEAEALIARIDEIRTDLERFERLIENGTK